MRIENRVTYEISFEVRLTMFRLMYTVLFPATIVSH